MGAQDNRRCLTKVQVPRAGGAAGAQNGDLAHRRRPTRGWLDGRGVSITTVNPPWRFLGGDGGARLRSCGLVDQPHGEVAATTQSGSSEGPDDIEVSALAQDVVTSPGQLLGDGLDGDHAVALGPIALAAAHAARASACGAAPRLPRCGAELRIVALITDTAPIERILTHIGEPAEPPRISPARGPPAWDDPPIEAVPDWDALAQPSPESVFNQEVQW